jgi:hypothetical protein
MLRMRFHNDYKFDNVLALVYLQIETAVAAPDEQGNQRVAWGKFIMSMCIGIPRENFRAFQTGSFELSMRYIHPNVDQPQPLPPSISPPRLSTSSSFLASPPRSQTHPAVLQHTVHHCPVSSLPPQPQYQMQYQQQQQQPPQYQQRQVCVYQMINSMIKKFVIRNICNNKRNKICY